MHHGHGVRTNHVGVTAKNAEHLIVFGISMGVLDADVPISNGNVYLAVLAVNLPRLMLTPRMSSSSICSK